MKKLINILLLITIPAIAQKLPQKTFYENKPIEIVDTVGGDNEGIIIRVRPALVYYYNVFDSAYLTPLCYIPKNTNKLPFIYGAQIDVFKRLPKINEARFKISTPYCEDYKESSVPTEYECALKGDAIYEENYGATMMLFEINKLGFGFSSMCGSSEIELIINNTTVVIPKNKRHRIDYFAKVNEFITNTALEN